jgi:hypothetical protein
VDEETTARRTFSIHASLRGGRETYASSGLTWSEFHRLDRTIIGVRPDCGDRPEFPNAQRRTR